jgi:uncharacterized membrane protein YfcA
MTIVWIVVIVFLASLVQSLSGFGFALTVMPLFTFIVGLQTAAPTVALTALIVYSINLVRYRRAIEVREVLRLGIASAFGVPLGIWVLTNMDETLVKQVMGSILIVYAAYVLARPTASWRPSRYWVYPAGFFAGCLSGAYNTPGPPVILYGSLRQWPRDEFRAVLQAIFFVNGALVVSSHVIAHRVNGEVLTFLLGAVPALMAGILVGSRLDRLVDRTRFRIIVASLVGLMGLALTLGLG